MGNKMSFMLQDEEITLISEETGFSPAQVERLYSRFTALDKSGNGSLSRQDCLAIPELAINPLCDRIVQMFFIDCDEDHDRINFRQFMKVLATFRSSSHRTSPQNRSRNVSRQESLNYQQQQSILKQAHLLFDSIDPTPFTAISRHHSRHSSFHDGFHDNIHQHHTTNQHSSHYAASSNHLPLPSNGNHHHNNNLHLHASFHHSNGHSSHNGSNHNLQHENGLGKRHIQLPLVDPNEPANSRRRKLHFMFKVYDVNDDNLIDIEDLVTILKMMVGNYVDDARVKRIAERTLREADKNCDGFIDFEEFCNSFNAKDDDKLGLAASIFNQMDHPRSTTRSKSNVVGDKKER